MLVSAAVLILLGVWVAAGTFGIVAGIRKKEWAPQARALAIILGVLATLPALYEMLVLVYVFDCTRPGNTCL
jgi:uncharacterized membrane protein HdeD (DUF308 family)